MKCGCVILLGKSRWTETPRRSIRCERHKSRGIRRNWRWRHCDEPRGRSVCTDAVAYGNLRRFKVSYIWWIWVTRVRNTLSECSDSCWHLRRTEVIASTDPSNGSKPANSRCRSVWNWNHAGSRRSRCRRRGRSGPHWDCLRCLALINTMNRRECTVAVGWAHVRDKASAAVDIRLRRGCG